MYVPQSTQTFRMSFPFKSNNHRCLQMLQRQICSLQWPAGNRNLCLGLRGERYFAIRPPSACIEMLNHSGLWDEGEGTSKQPISTSLNGCDILKLRSGSGSLNFPGSQRSLFPHGDFTGSSAAVGSIWILKGQERQARKGGKKSVWWRIGNS